MQQYLHLLDRVFLHNLSLTPFPTQTNLWMVGSFIIFGFVDAWLARGRSYIQYVWNVSWSTDDFRPRGGPYASIQSQKRDLRRTTTGTCG